MLKDYDYIVWYKDGEYKISKITRVCNFNRHTRLKEDEIIFIDNNSYEITEIQDLINDGDAEVFRADDVVFETKMIDYINAILSITNTDDEIYFIWLNVLTERDNNFVRNMADSLKYCKDMDERASRLANVEVGWTDWKDMGNDCVGEILTKWWKKHLGI